VVRYYGLYFNAHRGKKRKAEPDISHPPIIENETPFLPRKGWAEMIKKQLFFDCPQFFAIIHVIVNVSRLKLIKNEGKS